MNLFWKKHNKKYMGFVVLFVVIIIASIVFYNVLGYMGLIYLKADEGKRVYEFVEDMNKDGKNEKIEFSNHYTSFYKRNVCDAEYTSNFIKIHIDGKEMYSTELTTLGPLLNPQIVDSPETEEKIRQLYVHDDGGGPAPPMDFYFYFKDGEFLFSRS